MGELHVGTSGYAYKGWKGSFYPEKLPDKEMLTFYAGQFSTVEINYSFYQMPKESVLEEGNHLGPILVQLPPNFKFDAPLLGEFLALRPRAFRFAFEVRHASWYTEETYALLRRFETALCLAETDDFTPPDVLTAPFTYVRLRREEYSAKELLAWRKRFDAWRTQGADVYAYVKHEDAGKGPKYVRQLID